MCKYSLKELRNKPDRAFLKLHYMREHPVFIFWSTVYFVSFGKIQNEGQSAGNQVSNLGSSETTREAITLDDKKIFEWWLIGFAEGDGGFSIDKRGYLVFKVTQSSVDAQVLFYIKKRIRLWIRNSTKQIKPNSSV